MSTNSEPIACELTVFSKDARTDHLKLIERLHRNALHSQVPGGLLIRYPNRPGIVADLGDFVEKERQCCPSFTFELIIESGGKEVTLAFKGPPETMAGLAATIDFLRQGGSADDLVQTLAAQGQLRG